MTITTIPSASRASRVQMVKAPKSGVTAWLVEDYSVPLVALDFAMRGGSSQDPEGKDGVCAMMCALLDEGAGAYDADAFHRAMDEQAIEIGFSAERDALHGRLKTLTRHLDGGFDLLALAICEPRFDIDAIERVRAQMIAGLKRETKDPDALAGRAWREAAFAGHAYGRSGRGDLGTIAAIERGDLLAAHKALVARGELFVGAVGAIDADTLARGLDRVFGDTPERPQLRSIADVSVGNLGERRVIDLDIPQSTIRFGLPGVGRSDSDFWGAVVVNHVLGGGAFSARLFQEVREKRGLAYSVHSQLATFDHAALFSGGTSTKNERAAESLRVIEDEIAKMRDDGPSEDELDKARRYLTGSYALRFDTSTKIASNLVQLQLERELVSFLDRRNGYIDDVTMVDAKRAAKRLFDGKKLLVTSAGRPEGF